MVSTTTTAALIRAVAEQYEATLRVAYWCASWLRGDPAYTGEDAFHDGFLRGLEDEGPAPTDNGLAILTARARSAARDAGRRIPGRGAVHATFAQSVDAARVELTPEQLAARSAIARVVASLLAELSAAEERRVREFLENGGERPSHWTGSDRRAFARALLRLRALASTELRELFFFATS